MKVIVAGYSKTGTKSMNAALTDLDYKVYDYVDHFWYHGDTWSKIFTNGGSVKDFRQMYKDVDAVVDGPIFYFWEDVLEAFPDAKVILTTRDEESWYKSMVIQLEQVRENFIWNLMQCISPTGRRFFAYQQKYAMTLFGIYYRHSFAIPQLNELVMKKAFRRSQRYCLQNAPKDKLLVYSVKEGWEPLCKFLGKEMPDKPFPHENIAGAIVDKLLLQHPAMIRMQREMIGSVAILLSLSFFGAYKFYKSEKIVHILSSLKMFVTRLW